jgi:Pyruvate/2-oxoacid:ferredoxin oxidoreductase delta subunit
MKKILILYFSGAGATKKVAELIKEKLSQRSEADIFSVESKDVPNIDGYDALIIGTPTYHAAPAKVIMRYFLSLPRLDNSIPAFIFNTRGLASLNTNRILSKKLYAKNIITLLDREYRGPASDGALVAPFIKPFFEFEKNLKKKINRDCMLFMEKLDKNELQASIPKFRFGSIINAPNKLAGQYFTLKIHLHKTKCLKCKTCINECPHSAFSITNDGYPTINSKNCENCYRCIHHCPNKALSLSKRSPPQKTLHY